MKRLIKWIFLKGLYPLIYHLSALRPIKPKVVFVEIRGSELTDNYRLLYEAARVRQNLRAEVCYLNNLQGGQLAQTLRAVKVLWVIGDAKVVFVDDSSNVMGAFRMRSGSRMIQTWHACGAFKKWGFSISDKHYGDSRQAMERFPYHRNYSLVSVSGEAVRFAYAEAFGLDRDSQIIQALGVSRTDIFFQEAFRRDAHRKLTELWPACAGKKVILYAPTFRGQAASARAPEVLDVAQWRSELMGEYVLLIKHHPFVKRRPVYGTSEDEFVRDMTDCMSVEELLCVADICISDYSSLVFEYSLMEKPMIFWAFDREEYDDWRGFYFPYEKFVPGPIVSTNQETLEAVHVAGQMDLRRVREFREQYMGACDGQATERIMRAAGL